MLTVLDSIKLSEEYLRKYDIESPRLNAELLLADILNCKRLDLYLIYDKPLNENEISRYRQYLKRRSLNEPLQYITGNVEFYGINFIINDSVLIPRPETELLVESVSNNIQNSTGQKLLDIGIGSGNISVSLLKNHPGLNVTGIDISSAALDVALRNAEMNGVADRLNLKLFDILTDDISALNSFDIIISNPPYISAEDYNDLHKELKVYEPAIALTDYANGTSFYERIISISRSLLNPEGKLFFELGKDQFKKVNEMMITNSFSDIKLIKDYSDIERIIFGTLK